MTEPFSTIEIQLIKVSMCCKTDDEIAELLERSVQDVHEIINKLTGGSADERTREVESLNQEKVSAWEKQRQERIAKLQQASRDRKEAQEERKLLEKKNREEQRQLALEQRRQEREAERARQ